MLPYLSIYLSILENVESAIVDKAKQSSKPNDRHLPMSCSLVRYHAFTNRSKSEVEPSFAVQIRIPIKTTTYASPFKSWKKHAKNLTGHISSTLVSFGSRVEGRGKNTDKSSARVGLRQYSKFNSVVHNFHTYFDRAGLKEPLCR